MLVLTRCLNESIMIGDDIEISIHEIRGGQVKLAIAAPRDVRILRMELWRAGRREQLEREAAGSGQRVAGAGG
jgi:carbon storage regulator